MGNNEGSQGPDEAAASGEESTTAGAASSGGSGEDESGDGAAVDAARAEVIEAMARSMEVYGVKRSFGRLYGILYFADDPLSLDRLVAESGYAKSTVSTAMSSLERFHLVQRRSMPGEGKKAFFEAEEDLWYVLEQVLDEQVRREIQIMTRALDAAEDTLEAAESDRAETDLGKVRDLQAAVAQTESLLDVLAGEGLEELAATLDQVQDQS